ncbi:error-prone DNA polymerase [Sciscionella marina]|uniref:error-prone DNA polymerase n=1 Tax=Sciscionella marina TaxID=508770 RepID=UPI000A305D0A|nr:error-prone DNA polymerase [Sciscionella marina]
MRFGLPDASWASVERVASGRASVRPEQAVDPGGGVYVPPAGMRVRCPSEEGDRGWVPYAELHCHTDFSFLDGSSSPEDLVEEAVRLGLDAIAVTDHDGMYAAVRVAEAARACGIRTVYGAELTLDAGAPEGEPDPGGRHLLVLARGLEGYRRLCRVLSTAHLRGEGKRQPRYEVDEVVEELAGHVLVLSGCRKSLVRRALAERGPQAAGEELRWLVDRFGDEHVAVELLDHSMPGQDRDNDVLAGIAGDLELATIASGNVHYHQPNRGRLAAAMTAVRARRSLNEMDGWLPAAPMAYLRSGQEMAHRFSHFPGAVQRAALLGVECSLDLSLVAPELPLCPVPDGHDEASWLCELTYRFARERYGPPAGAPEAYAQLDRELDVIKRMGFPGYFLIVRDIVQFCEDNNILCQGRGSAANSAVCYALRITNADPVRWNLLFERFLSPERDGYPDIDVDIESGRREEVIQYVYQRYGRTNAAQVANVITYRIRSAVRDAAKALGYTTGQQDAFSRILRQHHMTSHTSPASKPNDRNTNDGADGEADVIPADVQQLAEQFVDRPRHLGIHSGGMVLSRTPVSEVCPVEWARMENRSVLQWDKDDCATAGLVKFDLLGLGMLTALHHTIDLIAEYHGDTIDLGHLDLADANVYDMLCRADAVGVFQVESRAQLATLPRLKPRCFYDLVVEVALIRPGPIQGGSVHPYLRRRDGEPWQHLHPLLANSLDRTLGVPLFQEQVMQVAIDAADFSPADADLLRRAMGAKRSARAMQRLRERFFAGTDTNAIPRTIAETIFEQVQAFSNYGFPESHAHSFAHLVYASAWLKHYYPAAFCTGLLRAQPMGFWSPQSLITDARHHGVQILGPDINHSSVEATLEPHPTSRDHRAIRLGLSGIGNVGDTYAEHIVTQRDERGLYRDLNDFLARAGTDLPRGVREALATAGAFDTLASNRREALWSIGHPAHNHPDTLDLDASITAPALRELDPTETAHADLWATGITPDQHPIAHYRPQLTKTGAIPAAQVGHYADKRILRVAGLITHRQRPGTAGGILFLNLEDETGMANILIHPPTAERYARALQHNAIHITGQLQAANNTHTLIAHHITPIPIALPTESRDYR